MNHMVIWWYRAGPYIRRKQLYGRRSEHSLKWRCDMGLCQRLTAKTLMMAAESDTETLVVSHTTTRLLCEEYLGVFTKLRKSTISFAMSVCPSVRLSVCLKQLGSHWRNFHEIWYLGNFRKSVEKIQVTLKTWRKTYLHLQYLAQFSLQWEKFQIKVAEKVKQRTLSSITLFENRTVYKIMWKNIVDPGRPKVTIQYGACALRAG